MKYTPPGSKSLLLFHCFMKQKRVLFGPNIYSNQYHVGDSQDKKF